MSIFPDQTLYKAEKLISLCNHYGKKVATAESCTGGLLSSLITSVNGSSTVFECAFICCSNNSRTELLDISPALIENYGVVSPEMAASMAGGAIKNSLADISVGITGIVGPDGGTVEKPVGLVYIALAIRGDKTSVNKYNFQGSREDVRRKAMLAGIEMLLSVFKEAIM